MIMRATHKEENLDALIASSADQAQTANMLHNADWRLGEETAWRLDQATGQLTLSFADGSLALTPAQIIGSFHHEEGSFLWGWDHPSVQADLKHNALVVKQFGQKQKAKELVKGRLHCTEQRAWELTALAMRLNHAKGAYRIEVKPNVSLFLNFGDVQVTQQAR